MTQASEQIIGVSCLLMNDMGLVFEIQKPHKWRQENDGQLVIGLSCIGGSLEEKETPVAALQREAQEEIGCRLHLRSARTTFEISPDKDIWVRDWSVSDLKPAIVWEGSDPGYIPNAKVAVYLGNLKGYAKPQDIAAVMFMDFESMLRIGSGQMQVKDIIACGAELRHHKPIPTQAQLKLVGTPDVFYNLYTTHQKIAKNILDELQAGSDA